MLIMYVFNFSKKKIADFNLVNFQILYTLSKLHSLTLTTSEFDWRCSPETFTSLNVCQRPAVKPNFPNPVDMLCKNVC